VSAPDLRPDEASPAATTDAMPTATDAAPRHSRAARLAAVLAGTLLGFLLLLIGGVYALLATEPGARLALRAATALAAGRLETGSVAGTLRGPLTLENLRWRDPAAGLDVGIGRLRLDWRPRALLQGRLHVVALDLQRVQVQLSEPTEPPDDQPLSLDPPLDIQLDALTLREATLARGGATLLQVTSAAAAAGWTDAGLQLRHLDLLAPQGEVHFAGDVDERGGVYAGAAQGRFRWQVGERRLAGGIEARARDTLADFTLRLTEPLVARLDLGLEQRADLPWRFTLEVPEFDPREGLLPDSPLRRVAAQLTGRGSLQRGEATGTLRFDEQQVELQPLRLERRGDDLGIDVTLRNAAGLLRANGDLWLSRQPLAGRFALDWRDVVLPAALAGQVLHSRGTAQLEGSLDAYRAQARFALGPPRRLADVRLAAAGTAAGIDLQQLEVRQAAGRLAVRGRIDFGAPLRWKVDADARDFDPGAFAAGWPGRLSFALASEGAARELADASASLQVRDLRGRLRGRAVAGVADLRLAPGTRLAGSADLRSGASRLRVDSTRGTRLDARLRADVPTLDDWLPGAAGSLSAQFTASGQWPMLRVAGEARGRDLRYQGSSVEAVDLDLDIVRPLEPRGTLRLAARGVAATGVTLRTVALRAEGEPAAHRVELDVDGEPVSTALRASGALAGRGWRGEVSRLDVNATGVARLVLQQPVALAWTGQVFELSRACFTDARIRLCLDGRGAADGTLQANYELANLPLALAAGFAPTALPVTLAGDIDGEGRIARDADGQLQGAAQLRSTRGRISLAPAEGETEAQELLFYDDLKFDADFAGTGVRARLAARIDDTGSIDGRLTASGVGSARTPLDGLLRVHLPSLAVAGAFVPQLANVDGRLDLDATIGGTLDQPLPAGELRVSDLVADIPELGVELRDGRLRVVPEGADRFALDGGLRSGNGRLAIRGAAAASGDLDLQIEGQEFLAADRPGARLVVAPDLRVKSSDGRIDVTGRMTVPSATIDLQRLRRGGGRARATSPDVVVIDDEQRLAKDAAALPLYALVDVRLGDAVKLVGFGLDATVTGALQVTERPGAVTSGSGEIRVAGTYKAYGQDLTVRQGQLFYAATPLDDPRLNIVAVRVVDTVTAGLRVTGRAQAPQLEVFSDPAMGQSSALSYLVAGKPLEAIGQGDAAGDALQSAARSLGTAAGGLLANNVGRRLGIDEFGIKQSAAVGGEVLTIGQYLSPRLFLSYGVGLFKPGEVVTLRYKLSDALSVEAENATESSRAGVEYRFEK
jgi:translocation and assembly module TamB